MDADTRARGLPPILVTRAELDALLERERRELQAAFELALDAAIAELRDELYTEVAGLTRRVDLVHKRALRALTHSIERRQ